MMKLFTRKKPEFGQMFKLLKKELGCEGPNMALSHGERMYKTPSGNLVTMQDYYGALRINYLINPIRLKLLHGLRAVKEFIGRPATILREYRSKIFNDKKLVHTKRTKIQNFAEKSKTRQEQFTIPMPKTEYIDDISKFNMYRTDASVQSPHVKSKYITQRTERPYAIKDSYGIKI